MNDAILSTSELQALARYAQQSIGVGSKSFAGASRLFGSDLKTSVQMLYAWCRHCDDAIDEQVSGFGHRPAKQDMSERLDRLREQTARALRGEADEPAFAALAYVSARHRIPEQYVQELLDGFEMDAVGQRYRSVDDTLRYSYHVAGVVGIMMAMVMGVRDEPTLDRACDLGIGFQLTNICRDVMDDARTGRVYLPEQWLGLDPIGSSDMAAQWVLDGANRAVVVRTVAELLQRAELYYDSAYQGLRRLPLRAACAIATARRVYREIGRQVSARGACAWDQRVVVSRPRKLSGALLGVMDAGSAHTLGRVLPVSERGALWCRPGRKEPDVVA